MNIHLRYEGVSRDYSLSDVRLDSNNDIIFAAIAQAADLAPETLKNYVIERGETDIVVHPEAVYG